MIRGRNNNSCGTVACKCELSLNGSARFGRREINIGGNALRIAAAGERK